MLRKHKEPDIRRHWKWFTVKQYAGGSDPSPEKNNMKNLMVNSSREMERVKGNPVETATDGMLPCKRDEGLLQEALQPWLNSGKLLVNLKVRE